jgi:hypothetical protein
MPRWQRRQCGCCGGDSTAVQYGAGCCLHNGEGWRVRVRRHQRHHGINCWCAAYACEGGKCADVGAVVVTAAQQVATGARFQTRRH